MAREYKTLPLHKEQIEELRKNPLWEEMVQLYGEENVINNYLVSYVILQEEKDIIDKYGQKLNITKDLILKVYHANQTVYEKFIEAPINRFKSWINDDPELVGHIPLITDHEPIMTNKHGVLLSGSLKVINIDGKLHLLCKALLMSPEAKWGYVSGNWRQVSPTILESYKISELSYVPHSAQMNNSSLSGGEEIIMSTETNDLPIINNDNSEFNLNEIENEIHLAAQKAEDEKIKNEIKQKDLVANAYAEQLVREGVITSGQKESVVSTYLQLSNGEEHLVTKLIKNVKKRRTPFDSKPRAMFLKGAIEMSTRAERFAEFKGQNAHINDALELTEAFQKAEADYKQTMQLSSGEGSLVDVGSDKKSKINEILSLIESDEEVDEEIKERIVSLCGKKYGLKLSDGSDTVDAGGVTQPNNTQLSGGEATLGNQAQLEQVEALTKGFKKLKKELAKKDDEINSLKKQIKKVGNPTVVTGA